MKSSDRISAILNKSNRMPYPHQSDAIKALDELDKQESYSTLLVLPTGGGKTYTASNWLLTHALDEGKKVLWLAHRHMLLDQAAESFSEFAYKETIPKIGSFVYRIISGAHQNARSINPNDDLLIVSKDSIRSNLANLDKWLANQKEIYLVVDEAHHSTAKTYQKVIDYMKSKVDNLKIIGLTATPTRTDEFEQPLLAKIYTDGIDTAGKYFNNQNTPNKLGMVYKIGLRELIKQEILSMPDFVSYETGMKYGAGLGRKALDSIQYKDKLPKEIEEAIAKDEARNKIIVEKYKENPQYGKTIVFTVSIEHAKILSQRFNDAGIKAAYVIAATPQDERERIYKDYRHGDLQVIVNVNILTEGTDLPMTQTVFLTRQTTSTILMTQMIGRALRGPRAGGTKVAYIVSFVDNWQEHIMWVVPETVYYGEIDPPGTFTPPLPPDMEGNLPTQEDEDIIYISQEKILEFAKILNDAIDTKEIEAIPFIERIPIGMYAFRYETKEDGATDGNDIACQVMVYNSTKSAYEKFIEALPELFKQLGRFNYEDDSEEFLSQDTLEKLLKHCKENFFNEEMIPPYDENDIRHIIEYYAQKENCPHFYTFAQIEREKLDISKVAQKIFDEDMGIKAEANYINGLWENADHNIWRIFFVDKSYFIKILEIELRKLAHPELYDHYQKATIPQSTSTPALPPPEISLQSVEEMFERLKSSNGSDKLAFKNQILDTLSKLEERAIQDHDAETMKQIGIYYGNIHEHIKAKECDDILANDFNKNNSSTSPTSSTNTNAKNISGTNLTWTLDDDGTLTISGEGRIDDDPEELILSGEGRIKVSPEEDCSEEFSWEYVKRNSVKKIIIEEGITFILNNFFACGSVEQLILPASIETIEWFAFAYCKNLKSVEILGNLDEIQGGTFKDCPHLEEFKINGNVKVIGGGRHGAFEKCRSLTNIDTILNSGVKIIRGYAFSNCKYLTSVTIPQSVTEVEKNIFEGCKYLGKIYYPRSLKSAKNLGDGNNAQLIPY